MLLSTPSRKAINTFAFLEIPPTGGTTDIHGCLVSYTNLVAKGYIQSHEEMQNKITR
jgi:hypothetical protein